MTEHFLMMIQSNLAKLFFISLIKSGELIALVRVTQSYPIWRNTPALRGKNILNRNDLIRYLY